MTRRIPSRFAMRESLRGAPLLLGKVGAALAAPHRVHEVVRDVDFVAGTRERVGAQDVADVKFKALLRERAGGSARGVADQAAHLLTLLAQASGKTAADEAAGAGDKGTHVQLNVAEAGKTDRQG